MDLKNMTKKQLSEFWLKVTFICFKIEFILLIALLIIVCNYDLYVSDITVGGFILFFIGAIFVPLMISSYYSDEEEEGSKLTNNTEMSLK